MFNLNSFLKSSFYSFQYPNFLYISALSVGIHSSGCFLLSTILLDISSNCGRSILLSSVAMSFLVGALIGFRRARRLSRAYSSKRPPIRSLEKRLKFWRKASVEQERQQSLSVPACISYIIVAEFTLKTPSCSDFSGLVELSCSRLDASYQVGNSSMTSNYSGYSSEPTACWTPTAAVCRGADVSLTNGTL